MEGFIFPRLPEAPAAVQNVAASLSSHGMRARISVPFRIYGDRLESLVLADKETIHHSVRKFRKPQSHEIIQ